MEKPHFFGWYLWKTFSDEIKDTINSIELYKCKQSLQK
jgi:hypothetical protein